MMPSMKPIALADARLLLVRAWFTVEGWRAIRCTRKSRRTVVEVSVPPLTEIERENLSSAHMVQQSQPGRKMILSAQRTRAKGGPVRGFTPRQSAPRALRGGRGRWAVQVSCPNPGPGHATATAFTWRTATVHR